MYRSLATALLLSAATYGAMAQSGTNSPYSQFGLGVLADQSSSMNRGMNGVALGFHEGNQINYLNPASYASIDSLSFIFDAGIAGQITNYKEGNNKLNANNANFEYIVSGFRAFKHFGVSFGLLPYTNINYSYYTTHKINDANNTVGMSTYSGSGGLRQAFVGMGWEPVRGLAIGVNGSYLYGSYNRSLVSSYSNAYANTLTKQYSAEVRNYKVDFGAQYTAQLNKKDAMTLGVTYGLGHKIGGKPQLDIISTNSQTSVSDTATYAGAAGNKLELEIPTTFGVGLMYNHNNQLKLGVDYNLQKWAKVSSPNFSATAGNTVSYEMGTGFYKNRQQLSVGADFCPQQMSRSFGKRLHYRAGVSYASPYYYINGQDGPRELSASLGIGLPIVNSYNNRSVLNISAQWVQRSATDFITENSFRINIGLTFNERWFAKWKVE